jgi:hypothetical protein
VLSSCAFDGAISSAVDAAVVVVMGVVIACIVLKVVDISVDVSSDDVVPMFNDMANGVVIVCASRDVVVLTALDLDVDNVDASSPISDVSFVGAYVESSAVVDNSFSECMPVAVAVDVIRVGNV